MNNENNNFNGTVLGSINNQNNNPMPNGSSEVLNNGVNPIPNSMPNPGVNPTPIPNNGVNVTPSPVEQVQNTMPNNNLSANPINNQPLNNNPIPNNGLNMGMNEPSNLNNSNNFNNNFQNTMQPNSMEMNQNNLGNNGMAPSGITPNYTNPNTINNPMPSSNGMPGFDTPNSIGTTPPISFEPENPQPQPKKKGNNTIFIVIVIIVLAAVGFGTYYVLKYTDIFSQSAAINIKTKDVEINIGEKLSIELGNYATITGTDAKNCNLDVLDVDTNKAGTYEYKVTCGETMRKGKITVIDNRALEVETVKVYKGKGETIDASEFIKLKDNNQTYEFVDTATVNNYLNGEPGTYTVKIKVTDNSNKTAEIEGTLIITENKIKGYYTCTSNEQSISSINANMTISDKFGIQDDENNSFANVAFEQHTFTFTDETQYKNLKAEYTTNSSITINNITGTPEFDDTNKKIILSNELSSDDVNTKFGAENTSTYINISTYFRNTLGYSCIYEKVQ